MQILLVDDDPNIAELVRLYLVKQGWGVVIAGDGEEALVAYEQSRPDLVILDLMLPRKDGWQVCQEIRERSDVPIIMLTARGDRGDKIAGLEGGADDYVVKPFDPQELVARVKANLRRLPQKQQSDDQVISLPGLLIDLNQYAMIVGGQSIEIPRKEIQLLHFLAKSKGRVFSREQLLEQVWGYDYYGDSRTIDVHIKRLRQRLRKYIDCNDWEIKTVWGVGYKLEIKNANE